MNSIIIDWDGETFTITNAALVFFLLSKQGESAESILKKRTLHNVFSVSDVRREVEIMERLISLIDPEDLLSNIFLSKKILILVLRLVERINMPINEILALPDKKLKLVRGFGPANVEFVRKAFSGTQIEMMF